MEDLSLWEIEVIISSLESSILSLEEKLLKVKSKNSAERRVLQNEITKYQNVLAAVNEVYDA